MSDVFDNHHEDQGPPENWKPSWARWQAMVARGTQLVEEKRALTEQVTTLTTQLETSTASLETAKTEHEQALVEVRGKLEETEIKSIPQLVEPDLAQLRFQHQQAMADVPEAQRQSLADWTKATVGTAVEKPEEAPRWIRGFLGDQAAPPAPPTGPKPPPKPPVDSTRRPAPPPSGGYTEDQIAAMSTEEYRAHRGNLVE